VRMQALSDMTGLHPCSTTPMISATKAMTTSLSCRISGRLMPRSAYLYSHFLNLLDRWNCCNHRDRAQGHDVQKGIPTRMNSILLNLCIVSMNGCFLLHNPALMGELTLCARSTITSFVSASLSIPSSLFRQ
jgi:hypothetical protein